MVKMSKWLEEEIVSKAKSDSIWQELYDKAGEDGALAGRITALVTYKDGMLFHKGKVWIPCDSSLRQLIMESNMTAAWPAIWAWIKPWNWLTETSTGQRWLRIFRTIFAVVNTARRTKRPDIRGMAHCILLNCPMRRGMLFPWTSSCNFPS